VSLIRLLVLAVVLLGLWNVALSPSVTVPGKLVASREPGWPQWRGSPRDGISDEKGLLPSWPEGGPILL
jgi:hypothetical protein